MWTEFQFHTLYNDNEIFKGLLNWCFWCVWGEDPFIGAALNSLIPWCWYTVKKSGCLFRGSVLMQMHAGICWQWKNQLLMLVWWAILGKRGRAHKRESLMQAAATHNFSSSPRGSMIISLLVIFSPQVSIKVCHWNEQNEYPPVLPSLFSVIWREKAYMLPELFVLC